MDGSKQAGRGEVRTKDGIIVFNILACQVPADATIPQLKKFFKKFGKVKSVHAKSNNGTVEAFRTLLSAGDFEQMMNSSEGCEYQIQFEKAKSAARALRRHQHNFNHKVIYVEPCASIDQPGGQNLLEQLSPTCSSNTTQNNSAPILTLNDDCLEHICKYLNPSDQTKFALTCRRFTTILALHSKSQYKNVDLKILKMMSPFEVFAFLEIVGSQIKSLRAEMFILEILLAWTETALDKHLEKVLCNVEKLKVIENRTDTLSKFIKNMHLLQELELFSPTIDDEFIKFLQSFKNLKKLSIIENADITGADVPKLTGLEHLTLYDCPEIMPQFKEICKNLSNLIHLDIRSHKFVWTLSTEDYEHITKYLPKLKTLKINCNEGNYNCLAQLPNLTKLQINFTGLEVSEEFFKHLATHQVNQLEELSIYSLNLTLEAATSISKLKKLKILRCNFNVDAKIMIQFYNIKGLQEIEFGEMSNLTDTAFVKLLKNCPKLKLVSFWCPSEEQVGLIGKSRKFLEQQRTNGLHTGAPMHFIFKRHAFDVDLLGTVETRNYSNFLKVTDEVIDIMNDQYSDNFIPYDEDFHQLDISDDDFYDGYDIDYDSDYDQSDDEFDHPYDLDVDDFLF